ncbi:hypothetical protein EV378_6625 [Pseudonocardia endophytica]|uniref:Uncharacterized protein n=1 Tax=Pseudonocardia endophytica TaxID=401976 RepID=A0A4R1HJV1_PSEEN|nr:hypothetical protein EV378_6625 [Pseudonocardia endophytica]
MRAGWWSGVRALVRSPRGGPGWSGVCAAIPGVRGGPEFARVRECALFELVRVLVGRVPCHCLRSGIERIRSSSPVVQSGRVMPRGGPGCALVRSARWSGVGLRSGVCAAIRSLRASGSVRCPNWCAFWPVACRVTACARASGASGRPARSSSPAVDAARWSGVRTVIRSARASSAGARVRARAFSGSVRVPPDAWPCHHRRPGRLARTPRLACRTWAGSVTRPAHGAAPRVDLPSLGAGCHTRPSASQLAGRPSVSRPVQRRATRSGVPRPVPAPRLVLACRAQCRCAAPVPQCRARAGIPACRTPGRRAAPVAAGATRQRGVRGVGGMRTDRQAAARAGARRVGPGASPHSPVIVGSVAGSANRGAFRYRTDDHRDGDTVMAGPAARIGGLRCLRGAALLCSHGRTTGRTSREHGRTSEPMRGGEQSKASPESPDGSRAVGSPA